jgi:outer membrane protease
LKKIFVLIFLTAVFSADALEDLSFNIFQNRYAPKIDLEIGLGGLDVIETVYYDNLKDKASDINYEMGAVFSLGFAVKLEPSDLFNKVGFTVGASTRHFFPKNSGHVSDGDWDEDGRELSWGESPASLLSGMENSGFLGIVIPINKKIAIDICAQITHKRYAVMAYNGYVKQEGNMADLYGPTMQYFQNWVMLGAKTGGRFKIGPALLSADVLIPPYAKGVNTDYHFFRKVKMPYETGYYDEKYISFQDKIDDGFYIGFEAEVKFSIGKKTYVSLFGMFDNITEAKGSSRLRTVGVGDYDVWDSDGAGAGTKGNRFGVRIGAEL